MQALLRILVAEQLKYAGLGLLGCVALFAAQRAFGLPPAFGALVMMGIGFGIFYLLISVSFNANGTWMSELPLRRRELVLVHFALMVNASLVAAFLGAFYLFLSPLPKGNSGLMWPVDSISYSALYSSVTVSMVFLCATFMHSIRANRQDLQLVMSKNAKLLLGAFALLFGVFQEKDLQGPAMLAIHGAVFLALTEAAAVALRLGTLKRNRLRIGMACIAITFALGGSFAVWRDLKSGDAQARLDAMAYLGAGAWSDESILEGLRLNPNDEWMYAFGYRIREMGPREGDWLSALFQPGGVPVRQAVARAILEVAPDQQVADPRFLRALYLGLSPRDRACLGQGSCYIYGRDRIAKRLRSVPGLVDELAVASDPALRGWALQARAPAAVKKGSAR